MLHQYLVAGSLKLLFVCVMFVPVLILVLVAKSSQLPVLLLRHVAVIVSLSLSLHITYRLGMGHAPALSLVGASPDCEGA